MRFLKKKHPLDYQYATNFSTFLVYKTLFVIKNMLHLLGFISVYVKIILNHMCVCMVGLIFILAKSKVSGQWIFFRYCVIYIYNQQKYFYSIQKVFRTLVCIYTVLLIVCFVLGKLLSSIATWSIKSKWNDKHKMYAVLI